MASEDNIFRPATELEKQNFVELKEGGQKDILDQFMAKLANIRSEFLLAYKPYDAFGARTDFEEAIRKMGIDASTAYNSKTAKKSIENFDLNIYGKPDRFVLTKSYEVTEEKIAGNLNTRVSIITGKNYEFKTKERGNGITIFVPEKDVAKVDEYINETYKSDKKKEVKK